MVESSTNLMIMLELWVGVRRIQGLEERSEDTTLGDAGVEDDGGGCVVLQPDVCTDIDW